VARYASVTAPHLMRESNKALVLNFIRRERTISRTGIARRVRLSRSTVSAIVTELMDEGWLVESGTGKSQGGRRPILLTFNYQAGYVLGIDVGATHLLALVTDLNARIISEVEQLFDVIAGPEIGLPAIVAIGHEALAQAGIDVSRLVGICVGVPGPLDYARGTVIAPPIMPGWDEVPVRDRMQEIFGAPVYLDNDANLGAFGELHYGAGQGVESLAYIKVATGIGYGIIIGGQIYHGQTGSAGEIGHVMIDEDGPPCKCGSYGCLEAMASGPAIAQRAMLAIQVGQPSILGQVVSHNGCLAAEDVARAALEGDALSQRLYRDAGRLIGIGVADLMNLLNPGRVIVGGGVAQAGELLLASLRETACQRTVRAAGENVDIVQAALGHRSSALGAVALVIRETFRNPVGDLMPEVRY
jgi:glucokinase-like ROK family protein